MRFRNDILDDYMEYGIEAINYVLRTNKRRNLTSSQWAAIAATSDEIINTIRNEVEKNKIENKKRNAGNQYTKKVDSDNKLSQSKNNITKSDEIIATTFNTNKEYVNKAIKLKAENPEKFNEVLTGQKTITEVTKEIKNETKKKVKETYKKIIVKYDRDRRFFK